jgi:hypothetical protein
MKGLIALLTEAQIEKRLEQMVRARGGLCFKFISPGNPGVPDRIVIAPDGRTFFVELKTSVGRLANIQRWQIDRIRATGADVRVIKGLDAAKAFVREVMPDEFPTASVSAVLR